MRFARFAAVILLSAVVGAGCTSVKKQAGVFEARGYGLNLLGFTLPRTDFESVGDAITRNVGEDAEVKTIWRSAPFSPWYNFLNPILGVEIVRIYGTY